MKKLPFYLVTGIAVAAVAGLVITFLTRRNGGNVIRTGPDYMIGGNSDAEKTFSGFNYYSMLSEESVNAVAEITLLQKLINAYYGSNTVTVSGTWNSATNNAIADITGKDSTNLYEFTYMYFVPFRGYQAAKEIVDASTTQA